MNDLNWKFPNFKHDLAIIGVGFLLVAAAVGACIGASAAHFIDLTVHRHRADPWKEDHPGISTPCV